MPQGDGGKQHGISPQQTHNAPRKPKEMKCEETAMRLAPRCDWRPPNPRWRRNLLRAFPCPSGCGLCAGGHPWCCSGVALHHPTGRGISSSASVWLLRDELWSRGAAIAPHTRPDPCATGCAERSSGMGWQPHQLGCGGNGIGERMAPRIMVHWAMSWCSQWPLPLPNQL